MWHRFELALQTPVGTLLLLMIGLLALLSAAYGFLAWRQRKQQLEEERRQRYEKIKRNAP